MALTKEAFTSAQGHRVQEIEIPELGDVAYIRTIRAIDFDAYQASLRDPITGQTNLGNICARLVVLSLCDADGNLIWPEQDRGEGLAVLAGMPAAVMDRLFLAVKQLNNLKSVEDAAKNSEPTADDSSSTG